MSQITTCTFFKVEGFIDKWWAFKQMRMGIKELKNIDGLVFSKILGSGAKNGFSVIPNFGTYVLLGVWESEEKANHFFKHNSFFKTYLNKSTEYLTTYAKSAVAHGKWDGQNPFVQQVELDMNLPIMVITRARIRAKKLLSFWRNVGKVSYSLDEYKGVLVSIGVGEWPLFQQATISIWKTQAEMMDYAYNNPEHKKVIALTRKLDWYKEEMFSRFVPYRFEGTWNGLEMKESLNIEHIQK